MTRRKTAKGLLRKVKSAKYQKTRARQIRDRAATLDDLVEGVKTRRTRNALLRYLESKMPDWSVTEQEATLSLLREYLPKPKGRKKGSVTKNRKPKKSDVLIAIALAVVKDKEQRPTAEMDNLIAERLEAHSPSLHDSETKNLTTVRNWVMKRPRAELMRRAASAGLVPPH